MATTFPPNSSIELGKLPREDLRKVQGLLLDAGFSPGAIDGLYGQNTQRAWGLFKKSVHLDDPQLITFIGETSYAKLLERAKQPAGKIHNFSTKAGTIDAIRWECNQHGLNLSTQQAYVLATTEWETARTFKPLEEYGKGRGRTYGQPDRITGKTYYGRGFVQLTWKSNYAKYGSILGVDLVNSPELACDPNVALFVLVHGMRHGNFTGRSLPQYVNDRTTDYINARRVVNGTDKAREIAALARKYL